MSRRLSIVTAVFIGIVYSAARAGMWIPPTAHAQGPAYYVDRNHPAADDSNPGTEALPWRTIQKAADTADPGATVYVKTGVYDERVLVSRDGTPTAKIAFEALPRRSVQVMHGFNISADGIRVAGFDITHNLTGWNNGGVWVAGNDVEVVDNYIHDIPYAGIAGSWSPNNWRNVTIAGNRIYRCNQGILMSGASDNWLVENNEIERLIRLPGGHDADYIRFFGTNHVIRRNFLHGTRPEEIGESHTDYFQTFANNGEVAHNILIEYNQGLDFAHQAFMMSSDGVRHSGITIRYNVFQGFTSWGVCAENIRDLHVLNNTWAGNGISETFHGVGFRNGSTGDIKNNLFAGVTSTYWRDAESSYTSGNNLAFDSRDAPSPGSPTDLLDTDPLFAAPEDILGPDGIPWTADDGLRLRAGSPAIAGGENGVVIGAYEFVTDLVLRGVPGDAEIYLDWTVSIPMPVAGTWRIVYAGGSDPVPAVLDGIPQANRSFLLTGLENFSVYTVTLQALDGTDVFLTDTIQVMPSDLLIYLPIVNR